MNRYTYVPGPKAHLAEDKAGEWVRYDDVEGIIEARDQAIALTKRFDEVVTKYQEALQASFDTTRQVWRELGLEHAVAVERAERRTRSRYKNGAAS